MGDMCFGRYASILKGSVSLFVRSLGQHTCSGALAHLCRPMKCFSYWGKDMGFMHKGQLISLDIVDLSLFGGLVFFGIAFDLQMNGL